LINSLGLASEGCLGYHIKAKNMPLETSYNKAVAELHQIKPHVAAAKSGCNFEQGMFWVPFFDRKFVIHFPEVRVEEHGQSQQPPKIIQLVLLHYLLTADGTQVADNWITYRQLPGTCLFEQRFDSLALRSMVTAFGQDLEGFRRAAVSLGGIPMSRTGNASFRFLALPKIPLACILYLGDQEMPSSANILFDASAPHYLPVEDITFLGSYLGSALCQRRSNTTT
jgi:hypothetical protein